MENMKKNNLNNEMIWKIWKKGKLNSDKIWNSDAELFPLL
jgi:hypothetical protein